MKHELFGCEVVLEAVQETAPAQVVRQVFGGDTAKARHPGLQTGVVAVDALDMPRAISALAVILRNKEARLDLELLGHRPVRGVGARAPPGLAKRGGWFR